jgi:hypothetical protein
VEQDKKIILYIGLYLTSFFIIGSIRLIIFVDEEINEKIKLNSFNMFIEKIIKKCNYNFQLWIVYFIFIISYIIKWFFWPIVFFIKAFSKIEKRKNEDNG